MMESRRRLSTGTLAEIQEINCDTHQPKKKKKKKKCSCFSISFQAFKYGMGTFVKTETPLEIQFQI